MTTKRRTEITVKTHTITIIRRRSAKSDYCEKCRAEVRVFTVSEIVSGFCLESSELKQLSLAGKIHFVGSTEMLCGNSISAYFINK